MEPKGLKPLTLSSRAASQSSVSSTRSPTLSAASPPEPTARKLAPMEEDDEDRKARHHLEATMQLLGLKEPTDSPIEMSESCTPLSRGSSHSSPRATGTPLSRLSSALGHSSRSPTLELHDPMEPVDDDAAMAALRAFDEREAVQARALSRGTAATEYTLPRPMSERRRLSGRRSSGSPEKQEIGRGMRVVSMSESISTLFSAGTDSRPGSVDLGK